jgi:hypothetical protein
MSRRHRRRAVAADAIGFPSRETVRSRPHHQQQKMGVITA